MRRDARRADGDRAGAGDDNAMAAGGGAGEGKEWSAAQQDARQRGGGAGWVWMVAGAVLVLGMVFLMLSFSRLAASSRRLHAQVEAPAPVPAEVPHSIVQFVNAPDGGLEASGVYEHHMEEEVNLVSPEQQERDAAARPWWMRVWPLSLYFPERRTTVHMATVGDDHGWFAWRNASVCAPHLRWRAARENNSVSAVVTLKDRSSAFLLALRSWLRHERIGEVVIVDWSSIVPVRDMLDRVGIDDPRVRIVRVEGMSGFSIARSGNLGFKLATGRRILKLDSDTIVQSNFFDLHPMDDRSTFFYRGLWNDTSKKAVLSVLESPLQRPVNHLNGIFYAPRYLLSSVNGFDERICTYGHDDEGLYQRMYHFGFVPRVLNPLSIQHIDHMRSKEASLAEIASTFRNMGFDSKFPKWSRSTGSGCSYTFSAPPRRNNDKRKHTRRVDGGTPTGVKASDGFPSPDSKGLSWDTAPRTYWSRIGAVKQQLNDAIAYFFSGVRKPRAPSAPEVALVRVGSHPAPHGSGLSPESFSRDIGRPQGRYEDCIAIVESAPPCFADLFKHEERNVMVLKSLQKALSRSCGLCVAEKDLEGLTVDALSLLAHFYTNTRPHRYAVAILRGVPWKEGTDMDDDNAVLCRAVAFAERYRLNLAIVMDTTNGPGDAQPLYMANFTGTYEQTADGRKLLVIYGMHPGLFIDTFFVSDAQTTAFRDVRHVVFRSNTNARGKHRTHEELDPQESTAPGQGPENEEQQVAQPKRRRPVIKFSSFRPDTKRKRGPVASSPRSRWDPRRFFGVSSAGSARDSAKDTFAWRQATDQSDSAKDTYAWRQATDQSVTMNRADVSRIPDHPAFPLCKKLFDRFVEPAVRLEDPVSVPTPGQAPAAWSDRDATAAAKAEAIQRTTRRHTFPSAVKVKPQDVSLGRVGSTGIRVPKRVIESSSKTSRVRRRGQLDNQRSKRRGRPVFRMQGMRAVGDAGDE